SLVKLAIVTAEQEFSFDRPQKLQQLAMLVDRHLERAVFLRRMAGFMHVGRVKIKKRVRPVLLTDDVQGRSVEDDDAFKSVVNFGPPLDGRQPRRGLLVRRPPGSISRQRSE